MTMVPVSAMSGAEMVELCKRHTIYEWSAQSTIDPIPVARAEDVYFWTPEGKRYLDFNSQLMCSNIGHGHPAVIRAIQEQAAKLAYANPFMATEARARLGAKLASIAPGDIEHFFFTNGGAEANENAIRIARTVTGRPKVLARYRAYHGATAGAISLTGDPRRWGAEPGIPGVVRAPEFHKWGRKEPEPVNEALADLEDVIRYEGAHTIAAFIMEPVVCRGSLEHRAGPDHDGQGVDLRLRAARRRGHAPGDRARVREAALPGGANVQQPSAWLRCGAGNHQRLRGRRAGGERQPHGRAAPGPDGGDGAAPPVGRDDTLDRALRALRAGTEPDHPRADGAIQRHVRRDGGARPRVSRK